MLDSVFAQTWTNYEVIVADDGSTDGTGDVLATYGDRIRVVTQQNSGPGTARNLGIELARGEYLAFLDSDDVWFPWTLASYARAIHDYGQPTIIAGDKADITETPSGDG